MSIESGAFFVERLLGKENTSVTICRSFILAYRRNIKAIRTIIRTTMITAITAPTTAPAFPLLEPLLCVAVELDVDFGIGFDVEVERTLDPLNEPCNDGTLAAADWLAAPGVTLAIPTAWT